jgi:hypothetical protein
MSNSQWAASVYYAEIVIGCELERAWERMLDYEAWNPSFQGAQVHRVRGEARAEGELVLIKKAIVDSAGNPWPEFYAETVKLVPQSHVVWYLYPKEGDAMRNFVDFELTAISSAVRFNIDYYAQSRVTGEALSRERKEMQAALNDLTLALKRHCEAYA